VRQTALLLGFLMIASGFSQAYSQKNCTVLKPGIDSIYTGGCKQGLADGHGVASGIDNYTGEFKKGLPNGIGTYTWNTGEKYEGEWKKGLRYGTGTFTSKQYGRDSIITGNWESDKYIGESIIPPFIIQYQSGISRVACVRTGDQPLRVYYKLTRGGSTSEHTSPISDLLLQGSSGNESGSSNNFGFDDVTFPFEGKIKFSAPSAFSSQGSQTAVTLNYELNLVINEPGVWMVTIFY